MLDDDLTRLNTSLGNIVELMNWTITDIFALSTFFLEKGCVMIHDQQGSGGRFSDKPTLVEKWYGHLRHRHRAGIGYSGLVRCGECKGPLAWATTEPRTPIKQELKAPAN